MRTDTLRLCDKALSQEHTLALDGRERFDDVLEGSQEPVHVQVRGERREPEGRPAERWMHLTVKGRLGLACVRCLEAMPWDIDQSWTYRMVDSEEQAARLDEEAEDHDVLVGSRHFDLDALVEDEILMALPSLPHHAVCPGAAAAPGAEEVLSEEPNPFAVLSKLKML